MSAEAREKLAAEAERQKNSARVVGGSLLGGLGDVIAGRRPDESRLQKRRDQIDEDTTGKFDKAKQLLLQDLEASNREEDRQRARVIRGREDQGYERSEGDILKNRDPNDQRATDAREMIKWASGKIGLPASNLDNLGIEQLSKHPLYDKAAELWEKEKMANRPASMGGYMPGDADLFKALIHGNLTGEVPKPEELPTANTSPKGLAAGVTASGAMRGRTNAQERFETPRALVQKKLSDVSDVLVGLDDMGHDLPNWNPGLLRNRVDALTWYGGLNDPQKAAVRTRMSLIGDQYRRSITGQAAGEQELARIMRTVPNPDDTNETAAAKLAEFQNYFRGQFGQEVANGRASKFQMGGWEQMGGENGWLDKVEALTEKPAPGSPVAKGEAPIGPTRFRANGKTYTIPAEKIEAFMAKFPDAEKL